MTNKPPCGPNAPAQISQIICRFAGQISPCLWVGQISSPAKTNGERDKTQDYGGNGKKHGTALNGGSSGDLISTVSRANAFIGASNEKPFVDQGYDET